MESETRVQILEEVVGVSLCANAPGKGINSSVLLSVMNRVDWVL